MFDFLESIKELDVIPALSRGIGEEWSPCHLAPEGRGRPEGAGVGFSAALGAVLKPTLNPSSHPLP
jgi:hypothetical protein